MNLVAANSGVGSALSIGTLVLMLGALALFIASRAAVDALVGGLRGDLSGKMALGHWLPIAAVGAIMASGQQPEMALSAVFGSSVAAVTLSAGLIMYVAPPERLPRSRRAWPFLLPAALLTLLAGFSAHLTLTHAVMLLFLGIVIYSVWSVNPEEASLESLLDPQDAQPAPVSGHGKIVGALQWILAAALAVLGAKLALEGSLQLQTAHRLMRGNLIPSTILGPLLVLPALSTGSSLAQRGRAGEAMGAMVGLSLLNLCVLVPAVIVIWALRSAGATFHPHSFPQLLQFAAHPEPVPMPLTVWRIDTVVLVTLGLTLMPVASGRWRIGRLESVGLVAGYAAYLAATALLTRRINWGF